MPQPNSGPEGLPDPIPAPGLQGDYEGSCIVCLHGTDTAVAVRGDAEAAIGFLMGGFGIPEEQASTMISGACDLPPGQVTGGEHDWPFRLCSDCAARDGKKPVPVGPLAEMPVITFGSA